MPFAPCTHAGSLHHYAPRLVAFEHAPSPNSQIDARPHNFILFVGGLGDSLLTVRYPSVLARSLPPSWGLAEIQTASSGAGFTTGSLERDSQDLAQAVTYFRDLAKKRYPQSPGKVVLLGHSTGCQDAINYLVGPWKANPMPAEVTQRPRVEGVIFQAGISDREGVEGVLSHQQVDESLALARAMIKDGRGSDHMPRSATRDLYGAQPTAERWLSLLDGEGDDDYFSSDLPDQRLERIWGERGLAARGVRVLALLSGDDEHMPKQLDKSALLARWETQVKGANGLWDEGSGVVRGAGHNLNHSDESTVRNLCERIERFVQSIDLEFVHRDTGKL